MTVRLPAPLPAVLALCLAVPFLLLGAVAPAAADCVRREFQPGGSPVIFSGTVVEERGTYARFEVERVWEGPDLADQVWVQGGTDQAMWPLNLWQQSMSSVDAEFEVGEDYVVGASEDFTTNSCSMMAADGVTVPDDARSPTDDGTEGADAPLSPAVQTAIAATVTVGLVLLVVAARRRGKRRLRDRPASAPRA